MTLTTEQQLTKEIVELRSSLRDHKRLLELKNEEIRYLEQQVAFFKATKYGPKSESIHPGQGSLFNEAETEAEESTDEVEFEAETQSDSVSAEKRRRPKRKPLPDSLKRVEEIIDLADDKKFCIHTGAALRRIGEEISERLDIVPAVVQVIRTVRPKYACSCGHEDCRFHIAPQSPQPIPKSNASAGLLAYIATAKYSEHCPLHRQEDLLRRMGCDLPRSTLANWMIRCGNLVMPLINLMRDKILEGPLVYCDETPVQVLKGTKKKPTSKSFMWGVPCKAA